MKTEYTRAEMTQHNHCVLCGNVGEYLVIAHDSECPFYDSARVKIVVGVAVSRFAIKFSPWKQYRWSWRSSSGVNYHAEEHEVDYALVRDSDDRTVGRADSLATLVMWIEKNQGVL